MSYETPAYIPALLISIPLASLSNIPTPPPQVLNAPSSCLNNNYEPISHWGKWVEGMNPHMNCERDTAPYIALDPIVSAGSSRPALSSRKANEAVCGKRVPRTELLSLLLFVLRLLQYCY